MEPDTCALCGRELHTPLGPYCNERCAALAAEGWQPVATAPRDGTHILGRLNLMGRWVGQPKETWWVKNTVVPEPWITHFFTDGSSDSEGNLRPCYPGTVGCWKPLDTDDAP